jgi:hypothetical protein
MTGRKKPGAAFWSIVALFILFVVYPLSMGPAWWLVRRGRLPNSTMRLYAPTTWMQKNVPGPIGDAIRWWAVIWQ